LAVMCIFLSFVIVVFLYGELKLMLHVPWGSTTAVGVLAPPAPAFTLMTPDAALLNVTEVIISVELFPAVESSRISPELVKPLAAAVRLAWKLRLRCTMTMGLGGVWPTRVVDPGVW